MNKILVTGADGYCGFPLFLKLAKEFPESEIIGVDNLKRREWVKEVLADSLIPIYSSNERLEAAKKEFSNSNLSFIVGDLTDYNFVEMLLEKHKPSKILHLASQPSAPYSQIDIHHCNFTQENNMKMTRNLCWGIDKLKLDTHLIITTTTGVYGSPNFPILEGTLLILHPDTGDILDIIPYPAMAGSWYHMSRAFDSANLWLSNKQFNFPISEFRTSIVFGTSTKETRLNEKLATRFDYDFYFGVVLNRFITMALSGKPITIYGKGNQIKPFISLEDMCKSLVKSCYIKPEKELRIFNQTTGLVSISDLAERVKHHIEKLSDIKVTIDHIENPRIENEEHKMEMSNVNFMSLLGRQECSMDDAISQMVSDLLPYKNNIVWES